MPLYAFSPYLPLLLISPCNEGRHRAAKHEEPCLSYALSVYHYFVFQVKSRGQESQFLSNGSQFSSTRLCCIFLIKTNSPKVFSPGFFPVASPWPNAPCIRRFSHRRIDIRAGFYPVICKKTIDKCPEYWYTYRVEKIPRRAMCDTYS